MAGPVSINISFDYKTLLSMTQTAPEITRNTTAMALGKSARAVQEYARAKHRFISRSGTLERSVDYIVNAETMEAEVYLDQSDAFYGLFIHDGTGTWGPRGEPYPIYPKAKKCLRFIGKDGSVVFAKRIKEHPGIRPDPFLYEAAAAQESKVQAIFAKAYADLAAKLGVI